MCDWPLRELQSRCIGARDECRYSMRRWHQQQRRDHSGVHPSQVVHNSASGAVLGHTGLLPFKRCRLSASPATGLVGMQENGFLCDYFGCVGFLPLTTQSHVRETMVKIMLTSHKHQPAFGDGYGEAGYFDAAAVHGGLVHAFGGNELPIGPSTCTFWCAVTLGALVKGIPIETVDRYLQLATEALERSSSGPGDVEVAKAWAMLGYLHGFMGDEDKFREYLALSDTFLSTSVEQESADTLPLGFTEIIQHRTVVPVLDHRDIGPVCSSEEVLPQLNAGASEHELCRYVLQSLHVFEQAVFAKMLSIFAAENEALRGAEPTREGSGGQPYRTAVSESQAMSEAMVSVWSEGYSMFGPLEEAVDRPIIRAGMGGMLINGTLMFEKARMGDVSGTLKRVGRIAEVFVRYPGLCRSIMGAHWVHIISAALAALDVSGAREIYNTLRGVYNPFRLRDSSPLPPLEEWQGLSGMCEDTYCRAFDGVIKSDEMKAFSNPADRSVQCEIAGDEGDEPTGPAGQDQSRLFSASITPGEEPVTPAPCCPGNSTGRSDMSSACGGRSGLHRAGYDGSERRSESTEAPGTPTIPASRTPTPSCCHSEAGFAEEHGVSGDTDVVHSQNEGLIRGMAAPRKTMLVMPQALGKGAVEYIDDDDLAAADWLEAVHALSEAAITEPGQAPSS